MYQYFLGIDISKDSFDFCFIDSNENLLDKNHYLMSYEDFTNLGDILSSYQDGLAEGYMGINGKLGPSILKGISCETDNALDFIEQVKKKTILFYEGLPKETVYKGIVSECETFIQNINKYIYLFKLCDVY